MILVRNLRLDIGQSSDRLKVKAARELKLPTWAIKDVKITKRSLDARRKNDIHWLYSAAVTVDNEEKLLAKCKSKNVAAYEEPEYTVPQTSAETRPVVAGFGPGGMFAALVLSMAGLKPVVLERGADAETRRKKVEAFRAGGELDTECNVWCRIQMSSSERAEPERFPTANSAPAYAICASAGYCARFTSTARPRAYSMTQSRISERIYLLM